MAVLPHFTYLWNFLCVALFPYFLLKILAWNHLIFPELSFLEAHQKHPQNLFCLFTHSLHHSLETLSWNVSEGNCRVPSTDFLLSLTKVLTTDQCVKTVVSKILTVLLLAASAHLLQLCPTLCNTMDQSLPSTSAHAILQARILEWVAIPFSRGSSWPRDRIHVSYIFCIGRQTLYH